MSAAPAAIAHQLHRTGNESRSRGDRSRLDCGTPSEGASTERSTSEMSQSPTKGSIPRRIKVMRPGEIARILERDPRLIIPVGTCEQHGPHLPLGSDTMIVDRLSCDLSSEFDVLLAPTVEYGVNVQTEKGF